VGVPKGGGSLTIVGIIMLEKGSSVDVAMNGRSETMVGTIGVAIARAAVLMRRRVSFMVEISFLSGLE
jgi:transcription termination factor Rho